MGWSNGSIVGNQIWAAIRGFIHPDHHRVAAQEIVQILEDEDCDTLGGTELQKASELPVKPFKKIVKGDINTEAFERIFGADVTEVDPNAYEKIQEGLGQRVVNLYEAEMAHLRLMKRLRQEINMMP